MEAYTSFAQVYDLFMDNVPYEEWSRYLKKLLEQQGISGGLICDLGCGTGKITTRMAQQGYQMLGVDISEDMLALAEPAENVMYLCQDMCELELHTQVDAMISICDSMNYLLEDAEMQEAFGRIYEYLREDGVFIFDLNTIYKYETILGETTICENREEGSFIWDNYYDSEEHINEYDLTLFIKEESGLYRRFEEMHYQRGYTIEEMQSFAEYAGFTWMACYDACTMNPPKEDSERIYIVLKKEGK